MIMKTRLIILLYVTGLALMIASEVYFTPPMKEVSELNEDLVGELVKTEITVEQADVSQDITRITPRERDDITFISFSPLETVHENKTLTVTGEVDLYHGNLQVVIDSVDPE